MNFMRYSKNIPLALDSFRNAKKLLRAHHVMQHEKALHCELAEWVIAEYLEGKRAKSGNQKGWDIELHDGTKIQVKSHAKADTNPSNWTILSKHFDGVSEVFIVLFSTEIFITTIFRISVEEAYNICNSKRELSWKKLHNSHKSIDLSPFKIQFPFLFN